MSGGGLSHKGIDDFFQSIEKWRSAYLRARLTLLGIRNNQNELLIIAARIYLDSNALLELKPHFISGKIEAIQIEIEPKVNSLEKVLSDLISPSGLKDDNFGIIKLDSNEKENIYVPEPNLLHPEGLNAGNRLAVLTIYGSDLRVDIPQPTTDWDLKAADIPYDSIAELFIDYALGAKRETRSCIEVVAGSVIGVNVGSEIKNTLAKIGVWMVGTLERSKVKIGFRVLDKGTVSKRQSFNGNELQWITNENGLQLGSKEFEVAAGSIIQCVASYQDQAHHVFWVADPETFQNSRVAVYNLADIGLDTLKESLFPNLPPRGNKVSDNFEFAVSWLLWMLGFSPINLGTHPKTKDALDIVSTTPKGDFVVVECTLGLLKAESKLAKLGQRVSNIRDALETSNMSHLRVLPIIVTALTLGEIGVDLAQAEELEILVLTKEDLEKAQDMLIQPPNPDDLFEKALQRVEQNKLKQQSIDGGTF
jgi:hypothetical protein